VGKIFVGSNSPPAITTAPYIFASTGGVQFQLDSPRPFDLRSIALGPINGSVGPQSVTFTGTLAGGGTVTETFATDGTANLTPFYFGSEFSDLVAVEWNAGGMNFDNIEAGLFVPEPSSAAVACTIVALGAIGRRKGRTMDKA
jgi:hypothetical protein